MWSRDGRKVSVRLLLPKGVPGHRSDRGQPLRLGLFAHCLRIAAVCIRRWLWHQVFKKWPSMNTKNNIILPTLINLESNIFFLKIKEVK